MMKFLFLALIPLLSNAQSSMDSHRWYLNPEGQDILISIDDLHDETVTASTSMKWGRDIVPSLELKKEIIIAVIDGGIEIDHPELKNHIAYNAAECFDGDIIPPKDGEDKDNNGYKGDCAGWDFVNNSNRPEDLDGHGTHVTGIIRSVMNGINGSFKFLPLKTFAPDEGRQTVKASAPLPVRLVKAFEYALSRNVDVIHLSVGWPKSFMTFELEEVIRKAIAKGVLVVAAAGNSSQRATIFPCQMEGVICVGALRPDGTPARFSNWGSQVDVFAPGEKILSTIPHTLAPLHISRKGYDFKNGTSQAAPFISATLAILKGIFPEDSSDALYSRLMLGARPAPEGKGLKGMFNLKTSLALKESSFVFPQLKGLQGVVVDNNQFIVTIPFKNFWKKSSKVFSPGFTCEDATVVGTKSLPSLSESETFDMSFSGTLHRDVNYINCAITIGNESLTVRLKVKHKLKEAFRKTIVKQEELLVINTRNGARSRFSTLNAIKGTIPGPYYFVTGDKKIDLYHEDRLLGSPVLPKGCSFLRIWQIDYDKDGQNELMLEGLCDKTHLLYQFLDTDLKEIYPSVKFKPSLTIINYDDFEVLTQKNLPPVFRFMNVGFTIPTDSPWDSDVTSKANHLYELFPKTDGDSFIYDVRILENPDAWMKSLKLRYMPSYQVLHFVHGKLLVKIGQKTAWINLTDQTAVWANMEDVLLLGSKKQSLIGTNDFVLQSFLTPFEYRGYMLNGVKIRFIQNDKFDPLLDILGTEKNEQGYKTTLRSFQRLIYLQYDDNGKLISRKENIVDRFDFLTAQDLIASVVNLVHKDKMIQIVDGTKVNTNYVDVLIDGSMTSFEIPDHCVTQNPVIVDDMPGLPVFCAKNKTEFEMRFIEL